MPKPKTPAKAAASKAPPTVKASAKPAETPEERRQRALANAERQREESVKAREGAANNARAPQTAGAGEISVADRAPPPASRHAELEAKRAAAAADAAKAAKEDADMWAARQREADGAKAA